MESDEGRWDYTEDDKPQQHYDSDELERARLRMKAEKDVLDKEENLFNSSDVSMPYQYGQEEDEDEEIEHGRGSVGDKGEIWMIEPNKATEDSTVSVSGPPAGDQPPANIWDQLDKADEEFKEQDHPRDSGGQFTSGASVNPAGDSGERISADKWKNMSEDERNTHLDNTVGDTVGLKKYRELVKSDTPPKESDYPQGATGKKEEKPKRKFIKSRQGGWYIDSPMSQQNRQNLINDVRGRINRLSNPADKERAQKKIDKVEDMSDEELSKYFMWMGGRPVGEGRVSSDTYYYDYSDYWKKGNSYVRAGLCLQAGIPTSWADTEWNDLPADVQGKIAEAGFVTSYESYKEMSWEFLPDKIRQKIGEGLFKKITEADWDGSTEEERKEMLKESGIENDEKEVALLSQLLDNELQEQEEGEDEEEDIAIIAQLLAPESEFKEQDHPRDEGGQFTSKGSGGGKHADKSEKELVKAIKGGSDDWHDWKRTEDNEELYAEIERRNQAVPKPKRPEGAGDTIFRDDPDAVKKMEVKVKYLEDVQDYWKKIIKFPARDYRNHNQLGDNRWWALTNASTNLREAKKKLEGIKAQQARGTQLVRKTTYKPDQYGKSKPRFYYSEEPKGEPPEEPWQKGGESYEVQHKQCPYCNFETSYKPNDLWQETDADREMDSHLKNKHGVNEAFAREEVEWDYDDELEAKGLYKCPDCDTIYNIKNKKCPTCGRDNIFANEFYKKKASELDDVYKQFTDPINVPNGKNIVDSVGGYTEPEANGQDLTGKTVGAKEDIIDFSGKSEQELEELTSWNPEDPYYKGEEEIIEKIPPKIKYHYYKQYPFGRMQKGFFGNEVSLDTMNQARVWWDNKYPDRQWSDMNIGERQRVIIAFLRDPDTALEKEPTHVSHKNYNIDKYIDDSLQDYLNKSEEQEAPAPPSGNGGEPSNGNMEEDKPTRIAGGIPVGYFAGRRCPKGQVYRNGKCRDESNEDLESLSNEEQIAQAGHRSTYSDYSQEGMLSIGNGEPCPYCGKIMEDFKIDGEDGTDHFMNKHPEEFNKALFGEGGLGSGKKGHQSWMRAIEEDSEYGDCPNCQVITERINGKCQMCGKKY